MRIGITECFKEDSFGKYIVWVHAVDPGVELVRLSWTEKNAGRMSELDGLLLTGGGDVHPRFYQADASADGLSGVDDRRDEFEFDVIERALQAGKPVLGVCRGMQVMNVYLGGTLVRDLESAGYRNHRSTPGQQMIHSISIVPHSMLHALAGATTADVVSSHHQAVDEPGRGLVRTAVSDDGVAEAAEWAMKDGAPFLLLVQWHPERSPEHPLSGTIARQFLREVRITHEQYANTKHGIRKGSGPLWQKHRSTSTSSVAAKPMGRRK